MRNERQFTFLGLISSLTYLLNYLLKHFLISCLKTIERARNVAAAGITKNGATTRIPATATPWDVTLLPGLDSILFKKSVIVNTNEPSVSIYARINSSENRTTKTNAMVFQVFLQIASLWSNERSSASGTFSNHVTARCSGVITSSQSH